MTNGFSGSYQSEDVRFLLKPVQMEPTPTREKERLIQSGERHYSEMLSVERAPDERYLALFHEAFQMNGPRFARDVVRLARTLDVTRPAGEVVVASLARAGTPVGVLLKRVLERLGRPATHYSVSIIRDRGIDRAALDYIRERHADASVVFVDGWTGKGAIATELVASVGAYNEERGAQLDTGMAVVADLAGIASLAATSEDYLIPSSILNSVVSGLVSRTVLNREVVAPRDFHACVYYREFETQDLSRWFVDSLMEEVERALLDPAAGPVLWDEAVRAPLARTREAFVARVMERYGVEDRNRVKPGIGESTRALLRRVPERLILRSAEETPDIRHLLHLAARESVAVELDPDLPYRAAVLIQSLGE